MLRTSDSDAGLQPQPGLADLASLVDHVRHTGLDVRLTMDLDGVQAPPAIELSVYRVVQESLTNVIKHAAAQHSEVDVRAAADYVEVKIIDDGPEATIRNTGHGLIGMRERVALYHGDFSAESGPGGFSVHARLRPRTANLAWRRPGSSAQTSS